jgi:hypothetical protein
MTYFQSTTNSQLETIRTVVSKVDSDNVLSNVPTLINKKYIYFAEKTEKLLFDQLTYCRATELTLKMYESIGRWLSALHGVHLSNRECLLLPQEKSRDRDEQWVSALSAADAHGIKFPLNPFIFEKYELVHGRFSTTGITDSVHPSILGWTESRIGNGFFDLSLLVSEIIEMMYVNYRAEASMLHKCADSFIEGYSQKRVLAKHDIECCSVMSYQHIVAHIILNASQTERWHPAAEYLKAIKERNDHFWEKYL